MREAFDIALRREFSVISYTMARAVFVSNEGSLARILEIIASSASRNSSWVCPFKPLNRSRIWLASSSRISTEPRPKRSFRILTNSSPYRPRSFSIASSGSALVLSKCSINNLRARLPTYSLYIRTIISPCSGVSASPNMVARESSKWNILFELPSPVLIRFTMPCILSRA